AAGGGVPAHNSSSSTSTATGRPTWLANNASRARCLDGPNSTSRPPTTASTGPNTRNSTPTLPAEPPTSGGPGCVGAPDTPPWSLGSPRAPAPPRPLPVASPPLITFIPASAYSSPQPQAPPATEVSTGR